MSVPGTGHGGNQARHLIADRGINQDDALASLESGLSAQNHGGHESRSELRPGNDPETAAAYLVLLAYGVNLRSRAGARATSLNRTVTDVLSALSDKDTNTKESPTDD